LLLRAQADDPEAWRRLVRVYGLLVYGWCRRAGLQAADAADVGQEVFLGVARGIAAFRRDKPGNSFRAWLFGITHNKVADHWRLQAHWPKCPGGSDGLQRLVQEAADEGSSSGSQTGPGQLGRLLSRALELVRSEFTETTWQAFWRVVVDGQAPADVAAALGVRTNVAYIAKSRVLSRLRQEFGDLID
jgi:RNA polymerase sigma-70 factor (ECF subfamily)